MSVPGAPSFAPAMCVLRLAIPPDAWGLLRRAEKDACQQPGINVAHFPAFFFSSCLFFSLSPCLMTLSILLNHFSHSSIAFLRAS